MATLETKDRAKVTGRQMWEATVREWIGDDQRHVGSAHFYSLAFAKQYGERLARKYEGAWASIRRGFYEAAEFEDGHDMILDAEWVEDPHWYLEGWLNTTDDKMEWEEG